MPKQDKTRNMYLVFLNPATKLNFQLVLHVHTENEYSFSPPEHIAASITLSHSIHGQHWPSYMQTMPRFICTALPLLPLRLLKS